MIDTQDPNARQNSINAFLELQERAMKKRLEYITVDIMPDSPLKAMKIEKINSERVEMETEFSEMVSEMVGFFGIEILNDLI